MDILRPNTMWIRNRCYRIISAVPQDAERYVEDDLYPEEAAYKDDLECGMETDIHVQQLPNGKFETCIAVASCYFPYIIGKQGTTKRRIETETNTTLKIPNKGKSGSIFINGRDIRSVRTARIKLENLVDQTRRRQPFTHFLSLPFNCESVQDGFRRFRERVLETCSDCRGVEDSLFQSEKKLHLTLCVMVLADERERQETSEVLKSCHESIYLEKFNKQDLRLELKGVEYMNDDPAEVDILYGRVNTLSTSLDVQDIADAYVKSLVREGLVQRQYEKVKLHVTLLNSLFRQSTNVAEDFNGKKERETFDARKILQDFEDFYFGEMTINEIHLSVRYTTSNSGYYTSSCLLPLPPD